MMHLGFHVHVDQFSFNFIKIHHFQQNKYFKGFVYSVVMISSHYQDLNLGGLHVTCCKYDSGVSQ